ncbi:hypothetical protein KIPB_000226 [Kipferlia bialata]|uniref:Short-chain dehydrogenase/reductase SDR n=1 Tax=Kipferlia bialata TaxID=797122 RepID=A0A9K3CN89_9EUKA|nr:hypothetical protein KIPB_000226 [Kipferlia bialata]|eukprot:g226.t1
MLFRKGVGYTPMKAYGRSKLANLLFTFELQRHLERHNIDCMSVAAHPGVSGTSLGRYMEGKWYVRLLMPLIKRFIQTPAMGALPEMRAASDPAVLGGQYYGPDGKREMKGYPVLCEAMLHAHSLTDAASLWEESERLTGVRYRFE